MKKTINFDMDGTIASLYEVENWLEYLQSFRTKPYREAKPLVNMRELGKELNRLQKSGWEVNIISWLSKCSNSDYDFRVEKTKLNWLNKHLGSVKFDNIFIVPYGTPKHNLASGFLFDDEKPNRENWEKAGGIAYDVNHILETLSSFA